MSIETSVRKEITEYEEKLILGLSIRQLACTGVSLVVGVVVYLLATMKFHISFQTTGYLVMIAAVPSFAVGFIRPKGFKFEVYARIVVKNYFSRTRYTYATNDIKEEKTDKRRGERKNELKPTQKGIRKQRSIADPPSESFRHKTTKKDTERKRKEAARKGKEETRRFIKEKQKAFRRAEKRSRT